MQHKALSIHHAGWNLGATPVIRGCMTDAPETTTVHTHRVSCDGAAAIRAGAGYAPSALGHPRIWLEIDEKGFVDCPYCDKRFVLAHDHGGHAH